MSKIYDNWERLVAAVLKREENWELCHAPPSTNSSFSSILSDFDSVSSSRFEEMIPYRNSLVRGSDRDIVEEWVENYERGVYVILGEFEDGTRVVILVGFSQIRFTVHQAEAWWLENEANVRLNYKVRAKLPRTWKSSKVKGSNYLIRADWIEQYETRNSTRVNLRREGELLSVEYKDMPKLAMVKNPILETNFNEILTSANLDGPVGESGQPVWDEKIVRYQPGVYVSCEEDRTGGNIGVERVRFSRNIFKQHEAVDWWVKNREKVYRRMEKRDP